MSSSPPERRQRPLEVTLRKILMWSALCQPAPLSTALTSRGGHRVLTQLERVMGV
jgi:hypothetical protein